MTADTPTRGQADPLSSTASQVTLPMRCGVITAKGTPCMAYRMTNAQTCYMHAPELATERTEARARGGKARHGREIGKLAAKLAAGPVPEVDAIKMLAHAQAVALAMEPSLAQARTLGYLSMATVKVKEVSELAARVTALEEKGEE